MADPRERTWGPDGDLGIPPTTFDDGPTLDASTLAAIYAGVHGQIRLVDHGIGGYLRTQSTTVRVALRVSVSLVVFGGAFALYPRPDLATYPLGRWVAFVAAFLALIVWAGVLALRPYHAPPPSPLVRYGLPTVALFVTWLQAVVPEADAGASVIAQLQQAGVSQGLLAAQCLLHGALFALPAMAFARLVDRGPVENLVGAGALGAALGNLVLHSVCPITDRTHLALGHSALAVILLVLVTGAMTLSRRLGRT